MCVLFSFYICVCLVFACVCCPFHLCIAVASVYVTGTAGCAGSPAYRGGAARLASGRPRGTGSPTPLPHRYFPVAPLRTGSRGRGCPGHWGALPRVAGECVLNRMWVTQSVQCIEWTRERRTHTTSVSVLVGKSTGPARDAHARASQSSTSRGRCCNISTA